MSRGIYDPINKVRIPTCGRESYNVDNELSSSSQNAVENRVITGEFGHVFNINDASENTLADDDLFPFYDTSASGKKKTTWSNIVAKIKSALSTVATSGSYNDLSNKPNLASVATSGSYNDLSNTPNLATVATSGSYNDLSGRPTLSTTTSQWTPHIYDLNTYKRAIANKGSYAKIGCLVVAIVDLSNSDLSGISTMLQIRNLPMDYVIGGTVYFGDLTAQGADYTFQAAPYVYFRPNITSSKFSNPSKIGNTSLMIIGFSNTPYNS